MNTVPADSEKLPDQLQANLRVVFVGKAAGQKSAEVGAYYAHRGNRFWSALYEVGLTSRRYEPHEFGKLLESGIGFTDLCKSAAGMDHQISVHQSDLERFEAKMRQYRPKAVAFTSKNAASLFLGRPTTQIALGRQQTRADFPEIFVLSSPSGVAASHWDVTSWHQLAEWIDN